MYYFCSEISCLSNLSLDKGDITFYELIMLKYIIHHPKYFFVLLFILVLFPVSSNTPSPTDSISNRNDSVDMFVALPEINLSETSNFHYRLAEVPELTTVINSVQIKQTASVSAIETLQDQIPGITIEPNAMGNNLRIKGLTSRYVLILVDGERLVSEGANGNINLDQINVHDIQSIHVKNGASSALYGSNAIGAVINIITKKSSEGLHFSLGSAFSSNNTWKNQGSSSFGKKKYAFKMGAFKNSSDGFINDNSLYAAPYSDVGSTIRLRVSPINNFEIYGIGRLYFHETFNLANSLNVVHPITKTYVVNVNGKWNNQALTHFLRFSLNSDQYNEYKVFEQKQDKVLKQNNASFISARLCDTYYLTKINSSIISGVEYNFDKNYARQTLGKIPTEKSLSDMNLFAQFESQLVDNIHVVVGGRYTYLSTNKQVFTPKFAVKYSIPFWKFRFNISQAYRTPSIKELYYDFDHQGMFWVKGNPNLKAEKGIYSSLSSEFSKGDFNTSLSVYYSKIDNKITQYDVITESGVNEKYYSNVSSAILKGINVSMSYTYKSLLHFGVNYSYSDAFDNSTKVQLSNNVKNSCTFSTTWMDSFYHQPFSLQISARYSSPKLYSEMVTDLVNATIELKESQSQSYFLCKAALVIPLNLNKHRVDCSFKVDNIFGFEDPMFLNSGRTYLFGINYTY